MAKGDKMFGGEEDRGHRQTVPGDDYVPVGRPMTADEADAFEKRAAKMKPAAKPPRKRKRS